MFTFQDDSEREGLTPCYYTNTSPGSVYRAGDVDTASMRVCWEANGYRLPTEAEWEKAARGGAEGFRFPWADNNISHSNANYYSSESIPYDVSPTRGFHPEYHALREHIGPPYPNPVGAFAPNAYGLHDMCGNAMEWCWDRYSNNYYTNAPIVNPRGPNSGHVRVLRGGSYSTFAHQCAVWDRYYSEPEDWIVGTDHRQRGFRTVRSRP